MILNRREWTHQEVWELLELLDGSNVRFGFKNGKRVAIVYSTSGNVEVPLKSNVDTDAITLNEKHK